MVLLANSYSFRMFMQSSCSPKQVHVHLYAQYTQRLRRFCMQYSCAFSDGATVSRSVRTRLRKESVTGSVITVWITFSFTIAWQLLENQHSTLTCTFVEWTFRLVNNGFLYFRLHFSNSDQGHVWGYRAE